MKVKLIYKDDTDRYLVRFASGKSKIVKLNEAYHLAEENKIGIGDSEYNESKNVKLDWTDGTPPESTREEKILQWRKEYWIKNKERLTAYQKEYHSKKKQLDKSIVNE